MPKVNVDNKASIPFEIIGKAIDDLKLNFNNSAGTQNSIFEYKEIIYKIEITYNKTLVRAVVTVWDEEAGEISKKGLKFPELV